MEAYMYGSDTILMETLSDGSMGSNANLSEMGLPQGLPTSPFMTIMALDKYLIKKSKHKMIMYADDGIFYGKGNCPPVEELLKDNQEAGIVFNREKSKLVKDGD